MRWQPASPCVWEAPLSFAARYAGADMALLYSGMREHTGGTNTYLFLEPFEVAEGPDIEALPAFQSMGDALPDWVGYLGYELQGEIPAAPAPVTLPVFRLVRYRHLLCFDHTARTVTHYTREGAGVLPPSQTVEASPAQLIALSSNFTRQQYAKAVADTVARIEAGDFYQANITRKFFGRFDCAPEPFILFQALAAASPAPYSAYIRHGAQAILSASPECFLTVDMHGTITTRPIKGSARPGTTEADDTQVREALRNSAKNQAENLMIVDLMRNDLARVSLPESVTVREQSGLYSYATIHHLISTITAQKQPDIPVRDVVRACFPPGSMTGAPKLAAIRWCAAQEQMARGVYSGAIGWFGSDGSCDLSVVIRTLVLAQESFEFQVGGGIVADSTPEDEWQETLTKARGICQALGIEEDALAAL